MSTFYNDFIQRSPYFKLMSRVAYPEMLEPVMRQKVETLIAEAAADGTSLVLYETYRSAGKIPIGPMHYGLAAVLVRTTCAALDWGADYTIVGALAASQGLVWGGSGPHNLNNGQLWYVQRISADDEAKLLAGSWFPDETYSAF